MFTSQEQLTTPTGDLVYQLHNFQRYLLFFCKSDHRVPAVAIQTQNFPETKTQKQFVVPLKTSCEVHYSVQFWLYQLEDK